MGVALYTRVACQPQHGTHVFISGCGRHMHGRALFFGLHVRLRSPACSAGWRKHMLALRMPAWWLRSPAEGCVFPAAPGRRCGACAVLRRGEERPALRGNPPGIVALHCALNCIACCFSATVCAARVPVTTATATAKCVHCISLPLMNASALSLHRRSYFCILIVLKIACSEGGTGTLSGRPALHAILRTINMQNMIGGEDSEPMQS